VCVCVEEGRMNEYVTTYACLHIPHGDAKGVKSGQFYILNYLLPCYRQNLRLMLDIPAGDMSVATAIALKLFFPSV